MRIVYLYTALTTMGGADRIIIQKANYLADNMGYDIYIITDSQNNHPIIYPLSSKVKHIDLNINFGKLYRHGLLIRGYYYFALMHTYKKRLFSLLKMLKADIVISTMGRDIDFLTQLKDGSKKIGEAHTTRVNLRNVQRFLDGNVIHIFIGKQLKLRIEKTIRELNAFVVLNEHEKKAWSDIKPAIVIPNSLPFYPNVPGTLTIRRAICVGRLEWEKGIDRLIDIWQRVHTKHPDWILDIYGEGTLREQLQNEIIAQNSETYIHLKGTCSNITTEYFKSSILILTSRYEGFPMVLLEAMACGIPCIAYNCPFGPQSIITNAQDGFLIDENDKDEMIEKINYLIENEQIRKELGKNARKSIQKYSQENIMKRWNDLFKSLINES